MAGDSNRSDPAKPRPGDKLHHEIDELLHDIDEVLEEYGTKDPEETDSKGS